MRSRTVRDLAAFLDIQTSWTVMMIRLTIEEEGNQLTVLTITAKGQITLKQELLRHLNITPGQKVQVDKLPDGRLTVRPAPQKGSIAAFSGSLARKGTPRLTIEQINQAIADGWAGKR